MQKYTRVTYVADKFLKSLDMQNEALRIFILHIDTLATLFGSCWTNSLHLDIELGKKNNCLST